MKLPIAISSMVLTFVACAFGGGVMQPTDENLAKLKAANEQITIKSTIAQLENADYKANLFKKAMGNCGWDIDATFMNWFKKCADGTATLQEMNIILPLMEVMTVDPVKQSLSADTKAVIDKINKEHAEKESQASAVEEAKKEEQDQQAQKKKQAYEKEQSDQKAKEDAARVQFAKDQVDKHEAEKVAFLSNIVKLTQRTPCASGSGSPA